MQITYPAIFKKLDNGKWRADFVDLPCCYAEGDTIDECIDDAIDSERDWIMARIDDYEPLPKVSGIEDIKLAEGEQVREIGAIIKLMEGWEE